MTKHVFNRAMVAHVWAQRDPAQGHGRSSHGNFSFDGDHLYSYRALIARFVPAANGETVALVSDHNWSHTTSGHQRMAASAVPAGILCFRVPHIGLHGYPVTAETHAENLAAMLKEYTADLARWRRKRDAPEHWERVHVERLARIAVNYAVIFGLTIAPPDFEADWAAVLAHRAEREARNNTPAAAAKREKARLAREKREQEAKALARKTAAERIAAWRAGIGYSTGLPWEARCCPQGGAMLRVCGDTLETSQGASVPLAHAVRVFRLARQCREHGVEWAASVPGAAVQRVGNFTVDAIDAEGTIRAGCHTIYWPEIEAAAIAAGELPTPESNTVTQETHHG